jgi:uncharacterized caspase-like protein
MIPLSLCCSLALAAPSAAAGPEAHAAPAAHAAYAVVVGSNRAGEGQKPLRFAQDDAERVREVLLELGGYQPQDVLLVVDPDRERLLEVLDDSARLLRGHRERGEDALFLFYYSGHAKAQALNLGPEDLLLSELDARLEAMEAKVTLVVMDACQAGALSQIKGAAPAADFSFNATAGLHTEGMAVLASSTATELSQESESLGGSYFTHHLVTGLRGAADQDLDGKVTLSEAYGYAYHRTLVSTAGTAVGKQHVTLETQLRGRGDMVLTQPGEASARLELEPELEAELLLHRLDSQVVGAELHKAAGSPLGLALVPGRYGALVRQGDALRRCELELAHDSQLGLDPGACELLPEVRDVEPKGAEILDRRPRLETAMVELGLGLGPVTDTAYTDRLRDFGFDRPSALFLPSVFMLDLTGSWSPHRNLGAAVSLGNLDSDAWSRSTLGLEDEEQDEDFDWITWRAGLLGRASLPLLQGWLVPYLQAGGGPAFAQTQYIDEEGVDQQWHLGWHVAGDLGLQLMPSVRGWRHVGIYTQWGVSYAPVIENLVGDVHNSGRQRTAMGLRIGF